MFFMKIEIGILPLRGIGNIDRFRAKNTFDHLGLFANAEDI